MIDRLNDILKIINKAIGTSNNLDTSITKTEEKLDSSLGERISKNIKITPHIKSLKKYNEELLQLLCLGIAEIEILKSDINEREN
jgi:hypothetical protein